MSTKVPAPIPADQAEEIAKAAFENAQLDSFEVRSTELVLTFLNSDPSGRLRQFRVISLNNVDLIEEKHDTVEVDLIMSRKRILPMLYNLLGEGASSAWLDSTQQLVISFENESTLVFSNNSQTEFDPLDFSWSIDFDDDWERTPGVLSLSCVVSDAHEPRFYYCSA